MVDNGYMFEFSGYEDNVVKFSASELDKQQIIDFLEYVIKEDIVYYEALVNYDSLMELISSLKENQICNGVLGLSKSDFWAIHAIYDMHKDAKDERDDFPASFDHIFSALDNAHKAVFPKDLTHEDGGANG